MVLAILLFHCCIRSYMWNAGNCCQLKANPVKGIHRSI